MVCMTWLIALSAFLAGVVLGGWGALHLSAKVAGKVARESVGQTLARFEGQQL